MKDSMRATIQGPPVRAQRPAGLVPCIPFSPPIHHIPRTKWPTRPTICFSDWEILFHDVPTADA